jgi:catechol 2,3-dioxygenase-like lactoylglutathione lyase family enzyme
LARDDRGKVVLPPVSQVGLVVADIEKAVDYYTSILGIGPFQIHDIALDDVMLHGRSVKTRFKMAAARSGQVEIELIQPVVSDNPYAEFLNSKGEGVHHLRFDVDDLDSIAAEWAEEGIEPFFGQEIPGVCKFAYFNTDKIGGMVVELIQWG